LLHMYVNTFPIHLIFCDLIVLKILTPSSPNFSKTGTPSKMDSLCPCSGSYVFLVPLSIFFCLLWLYSLNKHRNSKNIWCGYIQCQCEHKTELKKSLFMVGPRGNLYSIPARQRYSLLQPIHNPEHRTDHSLPSGAIVKALPALLHTPSWQQGQLSATFLPSFLPVSTTALSEPWPPLQQVSTALYH
jgi:hypothetical protein